MLKETLLKTQEEPIDFIDDPESRGFLLDVEGRLNIFINDHRGQVGAAGQVVGVVVAIFIGILIISAVGNGINRDQFTAAENTTFVNVRSFSLTAFELLGISTLVLAASVIIILINAFGGAGAR